MKTMPHRNAKFKKVKDNIAYYDVVGCNTTAIEARSPDKRYCTLSDLVVENEFINRAIDAAQQGTLNPDPTSKTDPAHYIQSLGVWFWMGIGFTCASGLFSVLFIFMRYCLFCVKGGSCGKRYPTVMHYSKFRKRFTLCLYIGFCASIIVLVVLGLVCGSESIGPALRSAAVDGPRDAMVVLQSVAPPLRQFTLDASRVMVASILAMNATIYRAVNMPQVFSDVACVRAFATGPPPLDADAASLSISNMQRHMGELPSGLRQGLERLDRDISRLRLDLPQLRTSLTAIQEGVPKLIPTARDLIIALRQLETLVASLSPYPTRIRNNFLDLLTGLPSDTELIGADGAGGLRRDLEQLGTRGCLACPDGKDYRTALVRSMRDVVADMADVPSPSGIADDVSTLRNLIIPAFDALNGIMEDIRAFRDAALPPALPPILPLSESLRKVSDVMVSFDQSAYSDILIRFGQAGVGVPDYSGLRSQLEASRQLKDGALACMQRLMLSASTVNSSLVLLPPEVGAVVRNFSLTAVQFGSVPNLQNISDAFGAYRTALRALADINAHVNQVVTLGPVIASARAEVSMSSLADRMSSLDVERPPLDIATLLQHTFQLHQTLDQVLPRFSTVDALRDMGTQVRALSTALSNVAARVELLQGAPEQQSAVLPAIDAIDNMVTALSGLNMQLPVDMELLAEGPLANLVDVSSYIRAAQNASTSAESLSDLSAYRRNIDAMRSVLPIANPPNFTTLVSQWSNVENIVASLPDLDAVKVQLRAIEDNYAYYIPMGEGFELAERHVNRTYELLVSKGPGILGRVRELRIKTILDENPDGGVRMAMEEMMRAIEDFYVIMEPSPDKPLGLLSNEFVQETLTRVSILTDGKAYSDLGGLYFIGSLFKEDLFFDGGDRKYLPWEDIDGNHYLVSQGPGRPLKRLYCLTDYCLKKAVDLFDDEPLSELFKRVFDSNSFNLMGISRRQAFYIAYTFPLLVMVLALLGIALRLRMVLSWTMWIILLATPIMFITAGALQWPSFVFVADGCRSSENLVSKALHLVYDTRSYELRGRPLDINLADLYDNVVSGCPLSAQGEPDQLTQLYETVIDQFDDYSRAEFDRWLAGLEPGEEGTPGTNMTATARAQTVEMDKVLVSLVRNVSRAVTCQELHDSYYNLKDSICCDGLEPFYWVFATWYMLAFCFCLCGTPASIWGRKRLVPPYGPNVEPGVPMDDETLARFYLSPKKPIRKRSWMTMFSFNRSSRRRPKTPTWHDVTPSPRTPQDPNAAVVYMGVEGSPRAGQFSPRSSPAGSSKKGGSKKGGKSLSRSNTGPLEGRQDILEGRENAPLGGSLPLRGPSGLRPKDAVWTVDRTASGQLSPYPGDGSSTSASASPQAKVRGKYAQVGEAFLPPPPSLGVAGYPPGGGTGGRRSASPSPSGTPSRASPSGTPPRASPPGTPPRASPSGTPPRASPSGTPPRASPSGTPPGRSRSPSPTREHASLAPLLGATQVQPQELPHPYAHPQPQHARSGSRGSSGSDQGTERRAMVIQIDPARDEDDQGPESPPLDHHLRRIFDGRGDGGGHAGGGLSGYPDDNGPHGNGAHANAPLRASLEGRATSGNLDGSGGWKFGLPLPPTVVERDVAAAPGGGRSPRTPEAAPTLSPQGVGPRTRSHPIMADATSPMERSTRPDVSPSAPPLAYMADEQEASGSAAQFSSFAFNGPNSSANDSSGHSFEFSLNAKDSK
eukprot:jgi/Mesvir1/6500/Mv16768-RA.2